MKAYIHILEYIIDMWDPEQQHFLVGTHILTINIEEIYFLTRISRRGRPVVLSGPQGGEISLDDIIDRYCALGTHAQSRKLHIQHIADRPLRMVVYTIEKVSRTRSAHLTTREHMMYSLECMDPTVFNWCEGMLVSLKDQLNKRK